MFAKAIVRPPAPNFAEGLTTAGLGLPDYQRALKQHEAYCAALERCGLTLTRLDADPNYPDSCFVEDTAIVIPEFAFQCARVPTPTRVVLTRPGAASRTGEVESMRAALEQIAPEFAIQQIQPPGTLDGGDICEAGEHYFFGLSERTNETGAEQLAQFVTAHGYTAGFVDIRPRPLSGQQAGNLMQLLHLKSGLAYLDSNRLVVTETLADRKEFADFDLVVVPRGDEYAANCIKVNDYVLVAAGYEEFAEQLRTRGLKTLALDMGEFQKMDGGLSCLSLRW
ncbi:MAG: dimethylarginine dimethylaminohydrolase family protein [Pyrinomonadaceae bacterium]